jgi:hypothetical protein
MQAYVFWAIPVSGIVMEHSNQHRIFFIKTTVYMHGTWGRCTIASMRTQDEQNVCFIRGAS